tara:strand:+ start:3405 stop:4298 length:894 start_codon:yes stop_codon:yes gene_type:complete
MSTIPLSKPYDAAKQEFPGFLSQKLDGVPVRIDIEFSNGAPMYAVQSRQAEAVPSVDEQVRHFISLLQETGTIRNGKHTFVAEVTHETYKDFKDVSGVVRRQEQQEDLILNVFDYVNWDNPKLDFGERVVLMTYVFSHFNSDIVKMIPQYSVGLNDYNTVQEHLLDRWPNAEGLVYRAFKGQFEAGKRRWNYMKILNEPTIDLRIVGFEEAVDKYGQPKGMVGRLIARYKDTEIGVGPGKLTHAERKALWQKYGAVRGFGRGPDRIAQIKYKKDDSYGALRQPTFQYWRDDKDTPDA